MNETILLVEDDASIREMLEDYLQTEGFTIIHAVDGEEAMDKVRTETFDLIVLDMMLPKKSGLDCLKEIRQHSFQPILILSAKDGEVDKAVGLGFGADDYVTKPFSLIELVARIKSLLRRFKTYSQKSPLATETSIKVHEIEFDPVTIRVKKRGEELKLTAKELEILSLFLKHPTKVFTKEQIFRAVWKTDYFGDDNVINVHMRRLREKIEDDPSKPQYIQTLWGIGYRLGDF